MPGKNTNSKKGSSAPKTGKIPTSRRAGLVFPVGRLNRMIKQGRYADRVSIGAGVYAAAVLEYLTQEICELAGNAAHEGKKKTITPRHLMLSVKNDEELNKLIARTTIATGGLLPNVHSFLFGKFGKKGASAVTDNQ